MTKRERFNKVFPILEQKFQKPITALNYETPYQLLIAVILSAQCTDVRVNIVTRELFKIVKGPKDLAEMSLKEIEKHIRSTGFYKNKAKNIQTCSRQLLEKYNGEVPNTMEELRGLAGVGRKTANVVLGDIWNIREGIVVDTHVKRISVRLGFSDSSDPVRIEQDLMKILPKENWIRYNIQIIFLGRTICKAPTPKRSECYLRDICPSSQDKL